MHNTMTRYHSMDLLIVLHRHLLFVDIDKLFVHKHVHDQYEIHHFYLFDRSINLCFFNFRSIDLIHFNSRRARN